MLDEADRMFDMGFLPDVRRILAKLSVKRQNLLLSATMPTEIRAMADQILVKPTVVQIGLVAQHGLHVTLFYDGKEALDAIFEDKFDILVLDINVPSLSGFELLKNTQRGEHHDTDHLHHLTGSNQRCEKRLCLGSGRLPQKPL